MTCLSSTGYNRFCSRRIPGYGEDLGGTTKDGTASEGTTDFAVVEYLVGGDFRRFTCKVAQP